MGYLPSSFAPSVEGPSDEYQSPEQEKSHEDIGQRSV